MERDKIKELEMAIRVGYSNIAGIVVQKNGEIVYENYFNGYTADNALHVYSVTKSVFSALIAIALDKGFIKSVDQKVLEFFPDYKVDLGEKAKQNITIRHLLTMTASYKYEIEPFEDFFLSADWLRFALDSLGGDKQPGEFIYSPIIGAHILSGILANATGRPIREFAAEYFFEPLGISVPYDVVLRNKEEHIAFGTAKTAMGWVIDPQGLNTASWGLALRPLDMAKIGQLYLNGGIWDGKMVVPGWWTDESTKVHSHWGMLSYGYLWWIIDENERSYAAMGDGGNVIYINTKRQMVVAIASSFVPDAKDRIGLIKELIEPLFD